MTFKPSLWSKSFEREGRTSDQQDAYSVAAWMRRADMDGSFAGFFEPSLTPSERTRAELEGWILGIKRPWCLLTVIHDLFCCDSSLDSMPEWYLYMVRCRDGKLYTGIATDVERRFADHQANKGAKYLRGKRDLTLVFKKRIGTHSQALKIERLVKRLPKHKKERLVSSGIRFA